MAMDEMLVDVTIRLCSRDGRGWTAEMKENGVPIMAMGDTPLEALVKVGVHVRIPDSASEKP